MDADVARAYAAAGTALGCVKTPKLNLPIESLSRFCKLKKTTTLATGVGGG
jgi:hypothetical protein